MIRKYVNDHSIIYEIENNKESLFTINHKYNQLIDRKKTTKKETNITNK